MTPLIIEAAINGMTPRAHNPHVPKTPDEVATDAIACLDAGATVIHSHIEKLSVLGRPAADEYMAAYRAIVRGAAGCDPLPDGRGPAAR